MWMKGNCEWNSQVYFFFVCDVFSAVSVSVNLLNAVSARIFKIEIERIPFIITFHPHAVKSVISKNFKLLQTAPETVPIFPRPSVEEERPTYIFK